MSYLLSAAFLGVGLVALIVGVFAELSQSRLPSYYPGSLRNWSVWLLIGGTILATGGLVELLRQIESI